MEVALTSKGWTINGEDREATVQQTGERSFQVIRPGSSATVHVLEIDLQEKKVLLQVNGKKAEVVLSSELDRLLKSMGLENALSSKVSELKAPMPGLIHSVAIKLGQEVKKGDVLLILEAMKMENVIKSPTDGTISKVAIEQGTTVEKGELLIGFE